MRYKDVTLASIGCCLPGEIVSSAEIEQRLSPVYQRLRLPEGRLALMSGIEHRRVWPVGSLPSDHSIRSVHHALDAAGLEPERVGALFHSSVCRDRLEPATACRVHAESGLPENCTIFDLSNACLGILNGVLQIANMIELGQIDAGIVVGSEGSRELLETTIEALNTDMNLTRRSIKPAMASLTIGSASCAILLTHRRLSPDGSRLRSAVTRAFTQHHQLCQSGPDEAVAAGMNPLMETDAETLMHEGVGAAGRTFDAFLNLSGWTRDDLNHTVCHQVGSAHRKQLLESLQLSPANDFTTFEWLGNTGSAALPSTMAVATAEQVLGAGDQVALLGIGSGINVVMMGLEWGQVACRIEGPFPSSDRISRHDHAVASGTVPHPPTARRTSSASK